MTRNVALVLAATMFAVAFGAATLRAEDKPELTKIERLLVKAQKICPVSGKDLESMGGPVKAEIDKQTVFLCCRGCLKRKVDQEHWKQVRANLAEAQGRCPVMDKPLPEDPASIVVKQRVVFVCCSPCTRKIKTDPDKYIATVDKLLEKNLGKDE